MSLTVAVSNYGTNVNALHSNEATFDVEKRKRKFMRRRRIPEYLDRRNVIYLISIFYALLIEQHETRDSVLSLSNTFNLETISLVKQNAPLKVLIHYFTRSLTASFCAFFRSFRFHRTWINNKPPLTQFSFTRISVSIQRIITVYGFVHELSLKSHQWTVFFVTTALFMVD